MRALLAAVAAAGSLHAAPAPQSVPILMYHVLAPAPAGAPFPELYVPPAEFRAQVRWLKAHGYVAVTLDGVWQAWHGGAALPAKPVVFSFDDGYLSDVKVALPALHVVGWAGVLNLEVRNLIPVWGTRPPGVWKLIHAGWEIDAHTLTHPDLTTLDAARLRDETAGSRAAIRRRFHVPADFFCYPSGRYDAAVVAAVRAAGYLGATTTNPGFARRDGDPYTLPRIRVNGSDGVRGLAAKLGGR